MKAPSSWHDDAQGRDAGHDDMQLHILGTIGAIVPTVTHKGRIYTFVGAYAEVPCVSAGSIIAFTDVMARYAVDEPNPQGPPKSVRTLTHQIHVEIKPNIYSAGACIRQAYALEYAIKKAWSGDFTRSDEVRIAVWGDDHKRQVLLGLSPFPLILLKRPAAGEAA